MTDFKQDKIDLETGLTNANDDLFRFANIAGNADTLESTPTTECNAAESVSDDLFQFAKPTTPTPEFEFVSNAKADIADEIPESAGEQVEYATPSDKRVTYKPVMFRPILYRCTSRCVTALTAVLLWKKFWSGARPIADGFTVAAICLFAMAWFSYLSLDGLSFHHYLEERKKKRKPRAALDSTDFADQHIIRDEELLPRERTLCSLLASVISGIVFLIVLVASLVL